MEGTTKSPLVITITVSHEGITVSNNLQLRSYVGTMNGMLPPILLNILLTVAAYAIAQNNKIIRLLSQ